MFIDTIGFDTKIFFFKAMIGGDMFSALPSYREAQIQVAKLERMAKAFWKKYPGELLISVPREKLGKMRAADVHRVYQQEKVVERLFMKLIEQTAVAALSAEGKKVQKGKIRSASQKFVHRLNSSFYKAHQKALKETLASLGGVLGGAAQE